MGLKGNKAKSSREDFAFRVKIGEYEVQIDGNREEVLKTIEDLPRLMDNVNKALEVVKPKKVTTLTVKTEAPKDEKTVSQAYPKIAATENLDDAVLKLLETDWGKWRPRTHDELKEALKTNKIKCSVQRLGRILMRLAKKEKVRRWKTDAGYVYILAEKETSR
jgi:hypothetical protein